MADLQGDSIIDDQMSLAEFMNWAKVLTGSKSLMQDKNSEMDILKRTEEIKQDQDNDTDPKQDDTTVEAHNGALEQTKISNVPTETSNNDAANGTATLTEDLPNSRKENDHTELKAHSPIISIAHKASKKLDVSRPETIAINQLDIEPPQKLKRPLVSMTPFQRKVLHKVIAQAYEEHATLPEDHAPTPFFSADLAASKGEVPERPQAPKSPQGLGKVNVESRNEITESKKAEGLLDSIHARSRNPLRSRIQTRGSPRPQTPVLTKDLVPSPTDENAKRDPMTFYEEKQKEYYPPAQSSKNEVRPMLQSKDPNLSMKSPKKSGFTGLDPRATEYKLTQPSDKAIEEAVKVPHEQVMTCSSTFAEPNIPETPLSSLDEAQVKSVTHHTTPSTTKDAIDDSTVVNSPRTEGETSTSDKDSSQGYDDIRSEKRLDLTPMLNVLGARVIKTPDEIASQEPEDSGLPVKTEPVERVLDCVTEVLAEKRQEEATTSRTLILRDLPESTGYTLVQYLIAGSVILKMELNPEKQCAKVKLSSHDECRRILEASGNGKVIKRKGKTHAIHFELSSEPEQEDSVLDAYLECGATRVVEVEDVDLDLTMRALFQLAQGSTQPRVVEAINDSFDGGARSVIFRFISVYDAVGFRSSLRRTDGWKDKKIEFAQDPCA